MRPPHAPPASDANAARPRSRTPLPLLVWLLGLCPALGATDGPAPTRFPPEHYLSHWTEQQPYRAPLALLLSASSEDQSALENHFANLPRSATDGALTDAQRNLAAAITNSLVRAASAPATNPAEWPLQPGPDDPDDLFAGTLPEIGKLRQIATIALQNADTLPAPQAVPIYAAVAQLSRQQRQGLYLIQQLTGINIEAQALAAVGRRLGEFDEAGLRALSEAWAGLQPIPDPRRALENERDVAFTFQVETIIRPGLCELLGEAAAGDTDAEGRATAAFATFTRDLRVSGLIDYGDGERAILFENRATGESFAVSSARPAHGIELLGIDFERREAIIRRGRREAVVHLESREITERVLSPPTEPGKRLRAWFPHRYPESAEERETRFTAWLEKVRAHPGGIDGYLAEAEKIHDAYFEDCFANASSPMWKSVDRSSLEDDPILVGTATVGGFLRKAHGAEIAPQMLQAAIRHQLDRMSTEPGEGAGANATPDHKTSPTADPWGTDGEPFARDESADGGFLLRSRYELGPGRPYTFKFTAPDAGFQAEHGSRR